MTSSSDEGGQQATPSPNGIQHMPRKRASGPGFGSKDLKLVEGDAPRAPPTTVEEVKIIIHERRYGHEVVRYACYAGASAVAYTYLNGFYHLLNKNRAGWQNTFRHRLFILSPLMMMYATGNGVIPMPFKRHVEAMVGRPALSTMDIMNANETLRAKGAAGAT